MLTLGNDSLIVFTFEISVVIAVNVITHQAETPRVTGPLGMPGPIGTCCGHVSPLLSRGCPPRTILARINRPVNALQLCRC